MIFKIAIGGICAEIDTRTKHAYECLMSVFGEFLSNETTDFIIEVVTEKKNDIRGNGSCYDEDTDFFDRVKVKDNNGIYNITTEFFRKKKQKSVEMGTIDVHKKHCRFFDRSSILTEKLLSAFFRCCFHVFLIRKKGFLLHCCAVVKDNMAYIFSGPGGSGKSTIANSSQGLLVLADDLVCVRKVNNRYYAFPTPWYEGKKGRGYEIKKLFFLEKSRTTKFQSLSRGQTVQELIANLYYNISGENLVNYVMNMLIELSSHIKGNILKFSLQDDLWGCIESLEKENENERSINCQIA